MLTEHSRVIEWTKGIGYRATCSCGWRTDYGPSEKAVEAEAELHKIKVTKTKSVWSQT